MKYNYFKTINTQIYNKYRSSLKYVVRARLGNDVMDDCDRRKQSELVRGTGKRWISKDGQRREKGQWKGVQGRQVNRRGRRK